MGKLSPTAEKILGIISMIDEKFYGPSTEHDPDEKKLRELYSMAIADMITEGELK